ncbi:RNA polymerase sigma factor [Chitinophaga sp. GCM10012297]|uniref:Sigma-70 family RNA polymerase sigma factor n=1 Tax=Chitinophaga chungangae TaxID=2821488 RepID=A0ABS3YID9_9BACT|nr:sigma-70 family RNA polymerase sigma factor [Chitinophaga chungangae]MBO9154456.1 sigma-70 family RNA polymerase sigma factor [Chitinophaga chungangae]
MSNFDYTGFADQELLHLLKEDDEAAFTEIYKRYWKLLYTTAFGIIRDGDAAQDILQEVFIRIWRGRHTLDITSLKPYLQQAARFGVLKAIRAQKTDKAFYDRLAAITIDVLAEDLLLYKEQRELFEKLLSGLPENVKEAFYLSRENNLTYKQIAARLNISEKTVEKRISKSLRYFRDNLNYEMCVIILLAAEYRAIL